jgi:hypothetical protein
MDSLYRLAAAAAALLLLARPAAAELIVNGNFEAGNTGFTSDYTYSTQTFNGSGQYTVMRDATLIHSGLSLQDHSTGSGLFLAAVGAVSPDTVVWSETVAVRPNTVYTFSAWTAAPTPLARPEPVFFFNGTEIGTTGAPFVQDTWKQFTASWNSGSATSLTIKIGDIIDHNASLIFNTFALDDISLTEAGVAPAETAPEPSALVLFGLGAAGGLAVWLRGRRGTTL